MHPLFDASTGPYRDKYCFWTGLHLLFLNLLFLIFALNVLGDPALNLFAIGSASLLLLIIGVGLQGIYKKWPLDILEASFIFNLGVTSYATLYANLSQTNMLPAVAYVSISMAFSVFVGIVVYHACLQVCNSRVWRNFRNKHRRRNTVQVVPEAGEEGGGGGNAEDNHHELRPLVLVFNELREPLLEYADNWPCSNSAKYNCISLGFYMVFLTRYYVLTHWVLKVMNLIWVVNAIFSWWVNERLNTAWFSLSSGVLNWYYVVWVLAGISRGAPHALPW